MYTSEPTVIKFFSRMVMHQKHLLGINVLDMATLYTVILDVSRLLG